MDFQLQFQKLIKQNNIENVLDGFDWWQGGGAVGGAC